jgi:hypothetical protein
VLEAGNVPRGVIRARHAISERSLPTASLTFFIAVTF